MHREQRNRVDLTPNNPLTYLHCYLTTGFCNNIVHGAAQGFFTAALVSCLYSTFAEPEKTINPTYSRHMLQAALFSTAAGAVIGSINQAAKYWGFTR